MMKKGEIIKDYIKGLKNGVSKGALSRYDAGWNDALKKVLGVTNSEEHKFIQKLRKQIGR